MKIDYSKEIILKNSMISVFSKGAGMLLSMVSSPIILSILGTTKYGVWASLLSVVSWIYYFDLGIGGGFKVKFAASLAVNDVNAAKKYLSVSYFIISIISAIAFLIAFIILNFVNVEYLLHVDDIGENINTILIIAFLFACLNFILQLVDNILYALQKSGLVAAFSVLSQSFFVIALLIYKYLDISLLLWVAVANGVSQLLKNIIATLYVRKKYSEIRPSVSNIDFGYSHGIMSLGLQMFVMQIAALILNTTDNLIILNYFGADEVTPYNFCYKYFMIIISVYSAVINPLTSAYTVAYEQKNKLWIKNALRKNFIILMLFSFGTIIAGVVFKPFAAIWLQQELDYKHGLIMLAASYTIIQMISTTYASFIYGIGKVKIATVATVVQALINIPVSITLAVGYNMGVNGVLIGSIISMAISAIIDPIITYREFNKMED